MREPIRVECGNSVTNRVMLKTAGEAGDVKTGWVRLSTLCVFGVGVAPL